MLNRHAGQPQLPKWESHEVVHVERVVPRVIEAGVPIAPLASPRTSVDLAPRLLHRLLLQGLLLLHPVLPELGAERLDLLHIRALHVHARLLDDRPHQLVVVLFLPMLEHVDLHQGLRVLLEVLKRLQGHVVQRAARCLVVLDGDLPDSSGRLFELLPRGLVHHAKEVRGVLIVPRCLLHLLHGWLLWRLFLDHDLLLFLLVLVLELGPPEGREGLRLPLIRVPVVVHAHLLSSSPS
mmetsp:Transcript_3204/g.9726  ORF Transcript_3204/g.9726 Transcript_3204/m.9726 type:complete len:237 (-) Transcript_3204:35-745(-)